MKLIDRYKGCLLGLACGDAVGTTVEFKAPGTFPPVTDMVGKGPFRLKAGQWTDDMSMALCLAHSLIYKKGFDSVDQMNRYCNWQSCGYMSSTGECFDIGNTVSKALDRYRQSGDPLSGSTDYNAAGNGSIMRLAPVPMFYYPDYEKMLYFSSESSRTTHAADECIDACKLLGSIIFNAFTKEGVGREGVLFKHGFHDWKSEKIGYVASGEYRNVYDKSVKGSGYVVDSIDAAMWCFQYTNNYKDAILKAANLGDDADTTAAICGQIAGAYYGIEGIPESWLEKLVMREEIENLADELYKLSIGNS
ncbi:MAG: ADP-ribosylglycohydrolase family protein [Gammaproteobacteria bacterium]|nr:MAG: ADP-ribosylglycohydrolase family protein [Gammaproteobacteria bacterium]